jgi:hypothetical protein
MSATSTVARIFNPCVPKTICLKHARIENPCYRQTRCTPVATSPRRGVATLEFVMSMPVVLTMFALLMWLGLSVIGQSEVTVQARHKAWKQRFDDKSRQPLIFPTAEGFYELPKDFAAGEATKNINAAPIFSRMPKPQSTMTVLGGSWDYRALPLDKAPHWKQHAIVLANSYTGTLQSLIGQLGGDPLDFLIGAAGSFAQKRNESSSAMNDDGGGGGSGSGGGAGGSTGGAPAGGGAGQQAEQQKEKTEAQRAAEKRQLTELREKIRAELKKVEGDNPLNPLGGELGEAREAYRLAQLSEDPNESAEDRKKRLARLEARVDLLKVKRDRLRMQLEDVNEDLDALG